ncbi:21204_t:CDS:2 [Rhizophagus irregularis]|nr:21204_t:CDS:2 [Rhizophagus irregularis]
MEMQLVKRQSKSGSTICKLVLGGLQPAGKLLCCEDNNPCLANPSMCTSTKKMAHCWFISQLDACNRNDTLAQTVCQYQSGIYCLKGVTDLPYDTSKLSGWNVIEIILGRNIIASSINAPGDPPAGGGPPVPGAPPPAASPAPAAPSPKGPADPPTELKNPKFIVCSDSMASGFCQIKDDSGYKSFKYDVEICDESIDIINSPPEVSYPVVTVTVTATPISNLSNHLDVGELHFLLLVVSLVTSLGSIIGWRKFGI